MNKALYHYCVRVLYAIVLMVLVLPKTLEAQKWTIYDGSWRPDTIVPAFRTASVAGATLPPDHSQILDDPLVPGNRFLSMNTGADAPNTFLWRMDWAQHGVTLTELTVVMRIRAHSTRTHALDFDIHFNDRRTRVTIDTGSGRTRVRNGTAPTDTLTEVLTDWNIIRFTATATETRLFINENPVQFMTIVPATAVSANRHFRIGDGDTGATFGADIDWIIWDVTGAYVPGTGLAIPDPVVTPSWDARLSILNAGGLPVPGFNPDILNYNLVLPAGTTMVPQITGSAAHTEAAVSVTQATALPGTATVVVTAQNGITTRTYSVNMRLISTDATLSALNADGLPVAGFHPDTTDYELILPLGATVVPVISATPNFAGVNVAITQAAAIPGTATVVVTAEDGTTTRTYTVLVREAQFDATLSNLLSNGSPIAGFNPNTFVYELLLPPGTTVIPNISAVPNSPGASLVITQATAIPGTATVVVTAEDGSTTLTYTVSMRIASTDATLSALLADGLPVAGFNPNTFTYEILLPPGAAVFPVISATANFAGANVAITQAAALPGTATVVVTAEDGVSTQTYTITITVVTWLIYDGSVLPDANVPSFMGAMGGFSIDHSQIIDDTQIPGNKFLSMNTTATAGVQSKWRMNWGAPPEGHNLTLNELTVVMRVKGHTDRTHALDFDMHFNDRRTRVSIETANGLARIRNGSGTDSVTIAGPLTNWNIYRFTMTATEARLYVNENPVPVMIITPAVAVSTNRHIRIGDGDTGRTFGADIDWIIWDTSGAFAPGQGSTIPPQLSVYTGPVSVIPSIEPEFKIFPNPATTWITVQMTQADTNPVMEIVNLAGKVVMRRILTDQQEIIDISGLKPGTYILLLRSETGVSTKQFVKY